MALNTNVQFVCLSRSPWLLFLLLEISNPLNIIQTLPNPTDIIKEGENTTLHCETDSPWFFCLWNSPGDDRHCAIQESAPVSVCSGNPGLELSGTKTGCSLHISGTGRHHHGDWLCLLNDIQDFQTVRKQIYLSVGRQADVSWGRDYRDGILVLTEGQETNLTCVAEGAIPAPSFSWQGAVNLTSVPGGGGASLGEDDQHTAWQTVQYTARLNDTGLNISCVVDQVVMSSGQIMYTTYSTLTLDIKPIIPLGRTVSERMSILAGILASVLLLLILIAIIIILLIARSSRKYKVVEEDEYSDPIWKPKHLNQDMLVTGQQRKPPLLKYSSMIDQHDPLLSRSNKRIEEGYGRTDTQINRHISRFPEVDDARSAQPLEYRLPGRDLHVEAGHPLARSPAAYHKQNGQLSVRLDHCSESEIRYLDSLNAEFRRTRFDLSARADKESPCTDTLSSGYATTRVSVVTPTCDVSTYSKESPTYLDTTLDSGYVTKDRHLDETIDSDLTGKSDQGGSECDQPSTENYDQYDNTDQFNSPLSTDFDSPIETNLLSIVNDRCSPMDSASAGCTELLRAPCGRNSEIPTRGAGSTGSTRPGSGFTIFDCEQGCFISVEEYNKLYGPSDNWYKK